MPGGQGETQLARAEGVATKMSAEVLPIALADGFTTDVVHEAWPTYGCTLDTWTVTRGDGVAVDLSISVVIAAYNEAKNIPYILPQIPVGVTEILVVDGGSTDGTAELALEMRPEVSIVHQTGKGKGDAMRAGFEAAKGDIIVALDADGSMSPREIPAFIDALVAGADLVRGTRLAEGGESSDLTPLRHLGNKALTMLFERLYKTEATDLCYGYVAFWRRHLEAMDLDCDGFEIETLINCRATKAGLNISEVGSAEGRRIHGYSNLRTFRDGARVLRTMLKELR